MFTLYGNELVIVFFFGTSRNTVRTIQFQTIIRHCRHLITYCRGERREENLKITSSSRIQISKTQFPNYRTVVFSRIFFGPDILSTVRINGRVKFITNDRALDGINVHKREECHQRIGQGHAVPRRNAALESFS